MSRWLALLFLLLFASPASAQWGVSGPLRVSPGQTFEIKISDSEFQWWRHGKDAKPRFPQGDFKLRVHKERNPYESSMASAFFRFRMEWEYGYWLAPERWWAPSPEGMRIPPHFNQLAQGSSSGMIFPGQIGSPRNTLSQILTWEEKHTTREERLDRNHILVTTDQIRNLKPNDYFYVQWEGVQPAKSLDAQSPDRQEVGCLTIGPLGPGFYIVEIEKDGKRGFIPCLVSDLLLRIERTGGLLRLQVLTSGDGKPVQDAHLWMVKGASGTPVELPSEPSGRFTIEMPSEKEPLRFWAVRGQEAVFGERQPLGWNGQEQSGQDIAIFGYSDRPIYRPGQEVNFKAIVRDHGKSGFDWKTFTVPQSYDPFGKQPEGGDLVPFEPGKRGLEFRIYGPHWEYGSSAPRGIALLLDRETLSFAGSFKMPLNAKPGSYVVLIGREPFYQSIPFEVLHYEKPRFKVEFQEPTQQRSDAGNLTFLVKAQNLGGGPVPGGYLAWDLFRLGGYRYQYRGDTPERDIEVVQSGEGATDRFGNYLLELPKDVISPDHSYQLLVKVTDSGGQRQMASRTIGKENTSANLLKLSLSRNILRPEEELTVQAEVVGIDGKPTSTPVHLQIADAQAMEGETWNRIDKWAPNLTRREANGPSARFRIPKGLYLLIAKAKLPSGESLEVREPLIVTEDGDTLPSPGRTQIRAAIDRSRFIAGQTARAVVILPGKGMPLFWGLSSQETTSSSFKSVTENVALLEFTVPESFSPNGWLIVESFQDGFHLKHKLPIEMDAEGQRLILSLSSDREELEPQQSLRLTLQAKDSKGANTRVHASVAVVDEAIFSLAPEVLPDPIATLNPMRPERSNRSLVGEGRSKDTLHPSQINNHWRIERKPLSPGESFKDTRPEDVRKAISREIATKPGAGAVVEVVASEAVVDRTETMTATNLSQERMSSVPVPNSLRDLREHFLDTALWAPDVEISGSTSLDLKMPDDLTRWRATAVGIAPGGKAGIARTWMKVSKPLQVNLVVPPNLTEGEESRAVVILQNRTQKPLRGELEIASDGGALLDSPKVKFALKSGGEQRLTWRLCPRKDSAMITVKAGAVAGDYKDGETRLVSVQKPGVEHRLQDHIVLAGTETHRTITVPAWGEESAAIQFFGLSGGLEQLAAPGLHYLVKYPYGCVEQTLSSFIPNILVAELVKQGLMPLPHGKAFEGLERNIQKGVERVYGYQMENGGWGWYGPSDFGASANPHTTGYAVMALSAMKRLGYEVDGDRLARGIMAAKALLIERMKVAKGTNVTSGDGAASEIAKARGDAAFLLVCLAQSGDTASDELDQAAEFILSGAWPGKTVLAQVCLAAIVQKHSKASRLLDALETSALRDKELVYWDGTESYRYSYLSGDVYTTVLALRALCKGRPESRLIPSGEAFLMTRFNGNGWDSTWATSQVVSLLPDLAKVRKMTWQGTPITVRIENGPTFNLDDSKPAFLPVKAGQAISFRSEGRGIVVYVLSAGSQRPMISPTSGQLLLRARRNIWKIEKSTQNIAQGWIRKPWEASVALHDEAYMEVEVASNKPVQYGLVEIPIPAGFEAITDMSDFVLEGNDIGRIVQPFVPEIHPDHVGFLVYWMSQEKPVKIRLRLRAKLEGRYSLRPVKFSLMSDESQWCTTEGQTVQIRSNSNQ